MTENIERFLDRHDDTSVLHDDRQVVVDVGKVFDRLGVGLERVQMDPATPVALQDLVDEEALMAVAMSGMGSALTYHMADRSVAILTTYWPDLVGLLDPNGLDPAQMGLPVEPESLEAAKVLLRSRLAGSDAAVDEVEALDVSGVIAVMASVLVFHVVACNGMAGGRA